MKLLALFLLLTGCAAPVAHKTPPVAPPSVSAVRGDIAKARTAAERIDGKATIILDWLSR